MAVTFDQLSSDQVYAVTESKRWYNDPIANKFPLGILGAAGTGKTTVARHVIDALGTTTKALAPTNRAAQVLRTKGVDADTIHKILFEPVPWCFTDNHRIDSRCSSEENTRKHQHGVRFFKRMDPPAGVSCFTIDECSMVGMDIARKVAEFNIPTLVIGDPYQLPPVQDKPGYTKDAMRFVELEVGHRFGSMSAIAKLANIIRVSSGLSDWHRLLPYVKFDEIDNYDVVLAWKNETRWQIIQTMRTLRGRDLEKPQVGDKLISVANTYEAGVLNGFQLTVTGEPFQSTNMGAWNIPTAEAGVVTAWKCGFQDHEGEKKAAAQSRRKGTNICALTWFECITVHKAQGGEWDNVLVVDDLDNMKWTLRNEGPSAVNTWAYTAVTRASQQVDFIRANAFPTGMRLRQLVSAKTGAAK